MMLSSPSLIALLGALVVYIALRLVNRVRYAFKAARLGCKAPVRAFYAEPSGVLSLMDGIRATKEQRVPDWLGAEFERMSVKHGRRVGMIRSNAAFFRNNLFTTEPKNIQTILATGFKDFQISKYRVNNFQPLLGHGIFAANGKQWEHSRAMLRPQFVRSQISDISLEERHVQSLMKVLDDHISADKWTDVIDLQPLFFRLTLDSATEFLFGESVYSQDRHASQGDTDNNASFAYAFDRSQYLLAIAGRFGPGYWMGHTKEFHQNVKIVHDFIDYFVQKALSQSSDEKADEPTRDGYVFLNALAKETSDPVELRSQLVNILLAGRDTTASTLGWFFVIMSNPKWRHVYKRLRDIVVEHFGSYDQPEEITFEGLKSCQYLQWCLNECLRLYPVVPINARRAVRDTVLPTGGGPDGQSPVFVKKGQDVAYSVHIMHRRKDLWGENAEEFIPERWEKRRPGWDYLPFNGGPRICIGQQFALTEVAYVLVRLVQRFDQVDGTTVGPVRHGLTLTNCPGAGVRVRLHAAEQ